MFTPFDRSYSPWLYTEHQGNVSSFESRVLLLCSFAICLTFCYPGLLLPRMAASVLFSSTLHDPSLVPPHSIAPTAPTRPLTPASVLSVTSCCWQRLTSHVSVMEATI